MCPSVLLREPDLSLPLLVQAHAVNHNIESEVDAESTEDASLAR